LYLHSERAVVVVPLVTRVTIRRGEFRLLVARIDLSSSAIVGDVVDVHEDVMPSLSTMNLLTANKFHYHGHMRVVVWRAVETAVGGSAAGGRRRDKRKRKMRQCRK